MTVEIVAPKAPEAGFHYHTVQQTADAASYLPKGARAVITTILLNVQVNPDDAYWAVEYKQADFHSYMTAGPRAWSRSIPTRTRCRTTTTCAAR